MSSFSEITKAHKSYNEGGIVVCGCGRSWPVEYGWRMHGEHLYEVMNLWLEQNGFGDPLGSLRMGTTCLHCGLLVGYPDTHRQNCP